MATLSVTALPAAPNRNQAAPAFIASGDAFLAALPNFGIELNAVGTVLSGMGLITGSTTSNSITIASKNFTLDTNLNYVANQNIRIYSRIYPDNAMFGTITSYDNGTGATVVNVTSIQGGGTFADWLVNVLASGSMAAQDANNVFITGGTINGTTLGATTPAAVTATTITASESVAVSKANSIVPLVSARFNASNTRIGFGMGNSNGFPFLGMNANPTVGSDNQTYDISHSAAQFRLDNGMFTFNYAGSGIAGNVITWSTAATISPTGLAVTGEITATAGGTFRAVTTNAQLLIGRLGTNVGDGWIGADVYNAFHTYNQALTASALQVTQTAADGTVIISSTGLAVTGAISATTRINPPSFTVATVPAAGAAGGLIFVSNAGGNGPCHCVSNGSVWKRSDNTSTTVA